MGLIQGLYDYRILGNVHVITASGGGSLVYTNVTERPHKNVYANWPTEHDSNYPRRLADFFDMAERFIGVTRLLLMPA
jgi:hypothetical protein